MVTVTNTGQMDGDEVSQTSHVCTVCVCVTCACMHNVNLHSCK